MHTIGILMGGNSSEHEISILSGEEVFKYIDRDLFIPHKFFIKRNGDFNFEIKDLSNMDVIFSVLHGQNGEDGVMQGFLQTLNCKYIGPGVFSSAVGMDKYLTRLLWQNYRLPIVPQHIVSSAKECEQYELPFVIKPRNSGSSVGVTIVKSIDDIESAFANASKEGDVIVEDFIKGRELTVGMLGNKVGNKKGTIDSLPIVEIIPSVEFYDYEAKYLRDDTKYIVPADLSEPLTLQIQNIALQAAKSLGIKTFCRIDFILDENNHPYLLEVNTLPGMTSHSLLPKAALAVGISYTDLLTCMIELALVT